MLLRHLPFPWLLLLSQTLPAGSGEEIALRPFWAHRFFYCLLTCDPASVMLPFTRSV